jgi:hypothetical protein
MIGAALSGIAAKARVDEALFTLVAASSNQRQPQALQSPPASSKQQFCLFLTQKVAKVDAQIKHAA